MPRCERSGLAGVSRIIEGRASAGVPAEITILVCVGGGLVQGSREDPFKWR